MQSLSTVKTFPACMQKSELCHKLIVPVITQSLRTLVHSDKDDTSIHYMLNKCTFIINQELHFCTMDKALLVKFSVQ